MKVGVCLRKIWTYTTMMSLKWPWKFGCRPARTLNIYHFFAWYNSWQYHCNVISKCKMCAVSSNNINITRNSRRLCCSWKLQFPVKIGMSSEYFLRKRLYHKWSIVSSRRGQLHQYVCTVAMVSTVMLSIICTSPFAVCMKLSSADNLFSGTLLLMPYRNEVVSHPPWHLWKERSAWHRRGPMSSWHLWIFQTIVPLLLALLRSGTR